MKMPVSLERLNRIRISPYAKNERPNI